MSSYIKKIKNPKTKKMQSCLCLDDYFSPHEYGYGFRKDGEEVTMKYLCEEKINFNDFDFYRFEDLIK